MKNQLNNNVVLIQGSDLSIEDSFLDHLPKTDVEKHLMFSLVQLIMENKLKNFYCIIQTSLPFDDGATYYEWDEVATRLKPNKNSRIAAKEEYTLLLGALLKAIINKGWNRAEAWDAICNNPQKLLQCEQQWPELLLLINLQKERIMLDMFPSNDVAFSIVETEESMFSFTDVCYQLSEYDYAVENYFNDYTFPCDKSPFQDTLDSLSKEAPDVKDEIRKAVALIIMDVD